MLLRIICSSVVGILGISFLLKGWGFLNGSREATAKYFSDRSGPESMRTIGEVESWLHSFLQNLASGIMFLILGAVLFLTSLSIFIVLSLI